MTTDQILARLVTASLPWEFAANVLLQTTLILAAGLLAGQLCKSGGAALQSLVYRTTLLAVLLCPLLAYGLATAGIDRLALNIDPYLQPERIDLQIAANASVKSEALNLSPIDLPLSPQIGTDPFVVAAEADEAEILITPQIHPAELTSPPPYEQSHAAPPPIDEAPQDAQPARASAAVVLALLAGMAWLAASMYLLARLGVAHFRTVRLRRLAIPADEAEVALCCQIAAGFHVRPPDVLRAPFLSGACLVGNWRPAILLPDANDTPLRQALLHELAHLSRRDCLWNLLRQVATALLPVQPLVWLLATRVEQTAEEVCDDFVVQHGADRCNYAEHLVELASRNLAPALPTGVGMISFRSLAARRIARILDASRTLSTRVGSRTIVATLLTAIAGTLLTASLGVGAGEAEAVEEQNAHEQTQNDGPGARGDGTTDTATQNALTIRGTGAEREMLVTGRVVESNGLPARDYDLVVHLWKDSSRETLSPKIDGDQFKVWVPIGGFSLELSARTKDGKKRAFQGIVNWKMRQAAIDGVNLTLATANRTVEVSVSQDGTAVATAHVTADLQGTKVLHGETNPDGKATFHLLAEEQLSQLTAWTDDFQVGGYAFYRKPHRDPRGTEFTIELEDCRNQTIRLVHGEDGSPLAGVPFTLTVGTGPPYYNFPGSPETLPQSTMTTNKKGEAIYRWFPDWKQHASDVRIVDLRWGRVESGESKEAEDGALVVKLKPRATRKPLTGHVTAGGLDVGGLLVSIHSFQGEGDENTSDHVYAITEHDGSFTADCLPGATYCTYVMDERYVSNIIDLIPYEPETGKSNAALLHVSEGEPVEIRVTSGPNRAPMGNESISLHAPHECTWREDGETRRGTDGKHWWVQTDEHGIARIRALAGSELIASVDAGEWRSAEQKVAIKAGGVTTIEFHREIDAAREVTGRVIPPSGLEVDLAHAEIVMESIDRETDERQTVETDERGRFALKTKALRFGIFAYTADGKAAGITFPDSIDQPVEVQLAPTADLHGRLLGQDDKPLVGHALRVEPQVRAKQRPSDVPFAVNFIVKEFETKTDSEGNYTLRNLPSQLVMTLRADPIEASEDDSHIATLILRAGEAPPRIVSRLGVTRTADNPSLAEKYESLLRDAVLGDFHMMVLVFDTTASDFVDANLLDYDKTNDVGSFMQLEIRESDLADAAAAEFINMKKWPKPRPSTVFAGALDESGKELGRIELDIAEADAAAKAEDFIRRHAPPRADAKEKWAAAFAEAKRSKRKVWARVSQRYCGPCFELSRWLDDHRELLARDYVLLKIDNLRDEHGEEVGQRIFSNRSHFGIPFYAIFDADQELLIDSEGPLGNIGNPSGYEGRRHLKKMLSDTRSNLTQEQIKDIVTTVNE
ncbi:MAG: M56 family metallopeptidase [Pirellulales bacterium]